MNGQIKKIRASLSDIYILKNFNGVVKHLRKEGKWTRGGILVADTEERIKNSVAAHELFPVFFPKIIPISSETYFRKFIEAKTLEEAPEELEKVIEKLSRFHQQGCEKLKNEKNLKIDKFGQLWKKGYNVLVKFLEIAPYETLLTYNVGDAKTSNLLVDSKYITFDSEGFSIGDISTDIVSIIETYQFNRKTDLVEKTLFLAKKKYSKLDKYIVPKSVLGLIGIRSLELSVSDISKTFFDEAIDLYRKFKTI